MDEKIRVIIKEPGKAPHYEEIDKAPHYEEIENDLETLQMIVHDTCTILVHAIRNTVNAPEDEDNMEKLRALVSSYDKTYRAKAQKPLSEPSSAI